MNRSTANTSLPSFPEEVCQQRCIHPEHVLIVRRHLLAPEAARSVADLFVVLSDPTRLRIVALNGGVAAGATDGDINQKTHAGDKSEISLPALFYFHSRYNPCFV